MIQRLRSILFAAAAALIGHGAAQAVTGPLDTPNKTELANYSALFWQYADTGTPGTGSSTFSFTDPNLNSPLFNPYRAALRKIQAAKGVDVDTTESCWGATGSVTAVDIKQFMLYGKITTPVDHTAEIAAHLASLLEALGEGQDVAVTFEDDKLVTVGLDPKTLQLVPIDNAPVPANPDIAALLNTVAPTAQQLAGAQNLSHVVDDPLVGNTPHWVSFMRALDLALGDPRLFIDARVTGVEAAFGDYGSLVLAQVETNQGVYLLVDTVNGAVAGPCNNSHQYDARALLATHSEYVDGQTIEYYSVANCAVSALRPSVKTPYTPTPTPGTPPPGWTPAAPAPGCTNCTPGRPTNWNCTFTPFVPPTTPATGTCHCESDYVYTIPGPCPGAGWNPPMSPLIPCLLHMTVKCDGGTTSAPCGTAGCPNGNSRAASAFL